MATKSTIEPGWFSLEGAGLYTGFSARSIKRAILDGKLPAKEVKVTGTVPQKRVKREHLDAWIEGRPMEPA